MEQSVQQVVERMGLKFEADGLPRIAGRLLGYLLLSPEPRSLDELSEDLLVSKTSASTNARLLERMGSLQRVSRPGDRRDYYQIAEDLHTRLLQFRVGQLRETKDLLGLALESPPASDPSVRERLTVFAAFFDHMLRVVREAGEQWRHMQEGDDADA